MTNILNPKELHSNLLAQEAEIWSKLQNRSEEKNASEYLKEAMQMLISQQNESVKNELKRFINNALLYLKSYQNELSFDESDACTFAHDMSNNIIAECRFISDGLDGNLQPTYNVNWDKVMEIMKQADSKFSLSREDLASQLFDIHSIENCLIELLSLYFWENISTLFQEAGYSVSYFCRDRHHPDNNNNKITIEIH